MNKKFELKWWDYRPWMMLLMIIIVVFWLMLGVYYYHASSLVATPENPIPTFLKHISLESLNANRYWWLISAVASLSIVGYLAIRSVNSLINSRSLNSIEDDLLMNIPVCTDSEIIEFNYQLGIIVSAEKVILPLSILQRASASALAHNLVVLLYLKFPEIDSMTRLGRHTALHSLADQLLGNWKYDKIAEFVSAMTQEKDYLGTMLDTALKRRQLELQVIELEKQISDCCHQEAHATDELRNSRSLAMQFSEYEELNRGKSAIVKWFGQKVKRIKAIVLRRPE